VVIMHQAVCRSAFLFMKKLACNALCISANMHIWGTCCAVCTGVQVYCILLSCSGAVPMTATFLRV
jgi:hypothetical protein